MPPPPPPPPPLCFNLPGSKKVNRRLSWSSADKSMASYRGDHLDKQSSFSSTPTAGARPESITFHSDSEKYDDVPDAMPDFTSIHKSPGKSKLARGNTITGTKKSTASSRWGYGWGVGKREKDFGDGDEQEQEDESPLPVYHNGPVRRDSKSSQNSRSTQRTQDSNRTQSSSATKTSFQTRDTHRSNGSRSTAPKPRPPLLHHAHDSTSTLVGSAYERKINDVESIKEKPDTTERLDQLRELMAKDTLDY